MQNLPAEFFVALAGLAISVAVLAGVVVSRLVFQQSPEQRRLRQVAQPAGTGITAPAPGSLLGPTEGATKPRWLPKSVREMSRLERRVTRAGFHGSMTARVFAVAQLVVPACLVLLVLAWFGWREQSGWLAAGFGAVVGYLAPGFVLDRRIGRRRQEVERGLPDVLDLLIVCLEAGSSLDQSIVKATEELEIAYPVLSEELRMLTTETRAGKPRLEAFKNFAQRTNVEDVRALVGMLAQTDRFGTSVGQALRTLADSVRTKRQQVAEEKAGKVGVKLVFPLVLCLFPAFFVVILGPAVITVMRALAE